MHSVLVGGGVPVAEVHNGGSTVRSGEASQILRSGIVIGGGVPEPVRMLCAGGYFQHDITIVIPFPRRPDAYRYNINHSAPHDLSSKSESRKSEKCNRTPVLSGLHSSIDLLIFARSAEALCLAPSAADR